MNMSRKSSGRQSDQVQTQSQLSQGRSVADQVFGRAVQPLLLVGGQRAKRFIQAGASLYFDYGQGCSASGDQVDLAERSLQAKAQDLIALGHQQQRREHLRAAALLASAATARLTRSEEHTSELQSH